MNLYVLPETYAVWRLPADAPAPAAVLAGALSSITRTGDELSIVCREADVPAGAPAERGWRCLAVAGPLPFEMTGVIASLTMPLAEAGVPVFVISTYDTDHLLVQAAALDAAVAALEAAGHAVTPGRRAPGGR